MLISRNSATAVAVPNNWITSAVLIGMQLSTLDRLSSSPLYDIVVKLAKPMKAKKPEKTSLALRFEEVRENTEGKPIPAAFAALIGLSRSAINQIDKGTTKSIKAETAFSIEDKTGYAARWVATGYGPKKVPKRPEDQIRQEVLQTAIWLNNLPNQQKELLHTMYSTAVSDDRMGSDWKSPSSIESQEKASEQFGGKPGSSKKKGGHEH